MARKICACGVELEPPIGQDGGAFRCPQCGLAIDLPDDETAVAAKAKLPRYTSWRDDFELRPHRHNVYAILALIFALSSFVVSIVGALPAISLGWLAKRKCDHDPSLTGRSLAGTAISIAVSGTVINFLILMLIPSVQKVRDGDSFHMKNMNNMRQLVLAADSYHDDYRHYPPAFGSQPGNMAGNHSAFVWLLPYIDQGALFQRPDDLPKGQKDLGKASVHVLIAPQEFSNDLKGMTSYAANLRVLSEEGAAAKPGDLVPLAAVMAKPLLRQKIGDGTSFTFLFANRFAECDGTFTLFDGMRPNEAGSPYFGAGFHSHVADGTRALDRVFQLKPSKRNCLADASIYGHAFSDRGLPVAMCDGSVRIIRPNVEPRLFQFGLCPNDGNQPDFD